MDLYQILSNKAISVFLFTFFIGLFACLVQLHLDIHSGNECDMTYIYMRFEMKSINVAYNTRKGKNYKLFVYNEGHRLHSNKKIIEENEIPVLFIPGSAGSAYQVRSVASVMQNEMLKRKLPFGFRFFAVDFNEEFTFLSGDLMRTQSDFTAAAMLAIRDLPNGKKKMIIVGHSYGGIIGMSLASHKLVTPEWIDLLILKSTPVIKYPILFDLQSAMFIDHSLGFWTNGSGPAHNPGMISYSGGLRDFVVPDSYTYLLNAVNRPTWALDGGPSMGTDHLCILWCNQIVRHITNMMIFYGENTEKWSGKKIVETFYKKEDERMEAKRQEVLSGRLSHHRIGFGMKRKFNFTDSNKMKLTVPLRESEVLVVSIWSKCITLATVYRSSNLTHSKQSEFGNIWISLYRSDRNDEQADIILSGAPNCVINVATTNSQIRYLWKWYEMLITSTQLAATVFSIFIIRLLIVYRETREQKVFVVSSATFIIAILSIYGTFLGSQRDFVAYATGISLALVWWCVCSGATYAVSLIIRFNLQNLCIPDHFLDVIFTLVILISAVNACIANMIIIVVFSLRHGVDAMLTSLPLTIPLIVKLIPFYQNSFTEAIFVWDLQHIPVFVGFVVYILGHNCIRIFGNQIPVIYVVAISMSAEFVFDPIPLESMSGLAVILLSGSPFLDHTWSRDEINDIQENGEIPNGEPRGNHRHQRGVRNRN